MAHAPCKRGQARFTGVLDRSFAAALALSASLTLGACATQPLIPYSPDTPPLVRVPAAQAGGVDKRARFREIYCAVLEAHGRALPDYRPCEESPPRSTIPCDGHSFELTQFHFHAPSENHINGKSFPLEGHLVHADKNGNLAVLAVMYREGAANPLISKLWGAVPAKEGDVPYSASYAATGASANVNTIWFLGLRMVFDWRHYW